jgi:hypothetical protein
VDCAGKFGEFTMTPQNRRKFSRGSFPVYHISKGIVEIILLIYFFCYYFFDFAFDIPLSLQIVMYVYFVVTFFDILRRIVIAIEFDNENKRISISYYRYFFRLITVHIDYSRAGFLKHNTFFFLPSSKLSKGLNQLIFYDDRKSIGQVVVSDTGWKSDQLEEMVSILEPFAHEFQLGPSMF